MCSDILIVIVGDCCLDIVNTVSLEANSIDNQIPIAAVMSLAISKNQAILMLSISALSNLLVHVDLIQQLSGGLACGNSSTIFHKMYIFRLSYVLILNRAWPYLTGERD